MGRNVRSAKNVRISFIEFPHFNLLQLFTASKPIPTTWWHGFLLSSVTSQNPTYKLSRFYT